MKHLRKFSTGAVRSTFVFCVAVLAASLVSPVQADPVHNATQGTDHATLQAAIDAAADGDEINLDAGTYTEAITLNDKGLTITGAGENDVIIQSAEAPNGSAYVFRIDADGSDITIQNLTIRNGRYGIRSYHGNVNVLHCTFINNGYDGTPFPDSLTQAEANAHWSAHATNGGAMRIQEAGSSEIAYCTLTDNDRGIRFQNGANGDIHDNIITGTIQAGIYLAASTYDGRSGCTNTEVYNNTCNNGKEHGLLSIGGLNNSFTGNTCNNNWNTGIMLWHPSEITVENNSFDGNNTRAFHGPGLGGDADGTVFIAGDVGADGAAFSAKILGNDILNGSAGSEPVANGVHLTSAPAGVTVDGNTFTGMDIDVHVLSQAAATVVNNNSLSAAIGVQNTDTDSLDATANWWGDESGPGGEGPGTGSTVSANVTYDPWWTIAAMRAPITAFALRAPDAPGPGEAITVHVDISSDWGNIASVGPRLTYDSSKVAFEGFAMGSGAPATWSAVYSETGTAGEIDLVITDVSPNAAVIAGSPSSLEAITLTFSRNEAACDDAVDFGFNSNGGATAAAFPQNQYIHRLSTSSSSVVIAAATITTGTSGPVVDDHSFIRGNLNNRSAHILDISDVIDLAAWLYSGLELGYDCEAAIDVNNDGAFNITDLVTQVQGIFNSSLITIPPPNFSNPGLGIAGVVGPDGGSIPSVLGCADGESCP